MKLPEKQPIVLSKQPVVTCFYCMKRDHSVRFCKIRKYSVPKGIILKFPVMNVNQKNPNLKGDQIFVLEISLCREI